MTDRTTRMIVLAVPGLGPLVSRELAGQQGVRVTATGNDGRADVVLVEVEPGADQVVRGLRSVEDVLVEAGRTLRSEGDQPVWIARRLWKPGRAAKAFGVWRSRTTARAGPRGAMTFRVVARVLQERSFRRTDLRRALTDAVARAEPTWRTADPARLEVWVLEYSRGRFVAGLRLTTAETRQHGGRAVERPGALRPTVAAAMVALASPPGDGSAVLLDPCCGSGTILAEAQAVGWRAEGRDVDRTAVAATRRNAPKANVRVGDARRLDLSDAAVRACVSNLPFGRQYDVPGDPDAWLTAVLAELARVTAPGGRVVLLVPEVPRRTVPSALRLRDRYVLRLLGTATVLWAFDRV